MAISINELKRVDYTRQADTLKLLGHPVRLKIVCGLLSGECDVQKLWTCLELPQSTISQHLSVLRHYGIVRAKRSGRNVRYSVADPFSALIAEHVREHFSTLSQIS
jgi:DNA-binding transcriptional ArsR family regulator